MIRRPPRSTLSSSSAASDVYKRQDGYSTNNISFTYFNSPNVTSIFPTAGPVKGGTTITVHLGRELLSELPSTICKFGHTLTSAAVWLDPAKLSCLSPMFHAETLANFSLLQPTRVHPSVVSPPVLRVRRDLQGATLGRASKERRRGRGHLDHSVWELSLIHISEPTRLLSISYAVFCLKKKKKNIRECNQTSTETIQIK
eukprot:TRINITY_DN4865_c0_g1_i3.p1 TRINITY_DN4865_c0_g1~~TRINITY_DN4865_c0_g1_i3.p1  ORF type:complete len:200 (-),score=31.31 TRINITY_DN4865_c0_g1_i3:65-664(-)